MGRKMYGGGMDGTALLEFIDDVTANVMNFL